MVATLLTEEERRAQFFATVAKTGKVYANPDTIRETLARVPKADDPYPNGSAAFFGVTMIPNNCLPVGEWYAIDVPSRDELMESLLTPAFD